MMCSNRFKDNDEYKTKIDAYRPLDNNTIEQIQEYYRVGLTYSSSQKEYLRIIERLK